MASLRRTHQSEAQRLMQAREAEASQQELEKELKKMKLVDAQTALDERTEAKRQIREFEAMRQEQLMEKAIYDKYHREEERKKEIEREEALATELARAKIAQMSEEKMRQQVRESSIELRELEQKLKEGYVAKERAAQIAEKNAIAWDHRAREAEIAIQMKKEYELAEEEQKLLVLQRNKEKEIYQSQLEQQLLEQEQKKQEAYEEFLKDKLMIDEIVRKIYEEDQREQEMKMESQRQTQRYDVYAFLLGDPR